MTALGSIGRERTAAVEDSAAERAEFELSGN
jgi:hypothetical protein